MLSQSVVRKGSKRNALINVCSYSVLSWCCTIQYSKGIFNLMLSFLLLILDFGKEIMILIAFDNMKMIHKHNLKKEKRQYIKISFIHNEIYDLPSLFQDKSVTSSKPIYFQNSEQPIICYMRVVRKIFRHALFYQKDKTTIEAYMVTNYYIYVI